MVHGTVSYAVLWLAMFTYVRICTEHAYVCTYVLCIYTYPDVHTYIHMYPLVSTSMCPLITV